MTYSPRYTTLDSVKAWGATKSPATTDDAAILAAIARAESAIDKLSGTKLTDTTYALQPATIAYVDSYGWLHAQVRHPIQSVSAIQVMDRDAGDIAYKAIALTTLELQHSTTDYPDDPPDLGSYWLACYSAAPVLMPVPTGGLRVKITYEGGFKAIPDAVEAVVNRAAWWYYKLREAPTGRLTNMMTGTVETPLTLPPDIAADVKPWRRLNS